jgi:hypothetical protein
MPRHWKNCCDGDRCDRRSKKLGNSPFNFFGGNCLFSSAKSQLGTFLAAVFAELDLLNGGDLYDAEGVRTRPRAFIDRHRARRRSYMASRNSIRDKLRESPYTSPAIDVEAHRLVFPQETFGFTLLT